MSRLEFIEQTQSQMIMDEMYNALQRRVESSAYGLCPVDMTRAFVDICHAQTCGKCVPCRVGLGQLRNLLEDVLEGNADVEILELIDKTAVSIMSSADCAIGKEAASMVHKSVIGFRDDYLEHIEHRRCVCTYSQPTPCVSLCPSQVDIPGYIALILEGKYQDAIRLIRRDNPFPTTCGFVCEHPCEVKCRRNIVDDAINIRGLKRFAADVAGEVDPPPCARSTGKKIAIVGGGPGGLSAAYYLQLKGHETTVFEMLPELGGMLRYGIPNYRLPKERLDDDINAILKTGVKVVMNTKIGDDISFEKLREDFDAVAIFIGANTDKKIGLDNEEAEGIYSAVEFLRSVGHGEKMNLYGKEVCVIGGGNVTMDVVRTAKRLGAKKVSVVYRRRVADMTALPLEIEGAIAEGVEIQTLKSPKSINVDENNNVKSITVEPQMISSIANGRASTKSTGEADVDLPCEILVVAIGQDIESGHFENVGVPVFRGKINAQTTGTFDGLPNVFAGGDCVSGPQSVVLAIQGAKVVASNIDEFLGFNTPISTDIQIPVPTSNDRIPCGRVNMTEREAGERVCDFEGVELGMSEAEAHQEASRCLRCDHFGFGILKGGREQLW